MRNVSVAPTVDRSALGITVDFAKAVSWHLEGGPWDRRRARSGRGSTGSPHRVPYMICRKRFGAGS